MFSINLVKGKNYQFWTLITLFLVCIDISLQFVFNYFFCRPQIHCRTCFSAHETISSRIFNQRISRLRYRHLVYELILVFNVGFNLLNFFSAATSMKWIEVKMRELGVTNNPNYNITFFLDCSAMITVSTQKYGIVNVCHRFISANFF